MGKRGNTGIRRIVNAAGYSVQGIGAAWKHEAAFRQECVLTLALVPVAIWLGRSAVDYALLIGTCLLVLIVELLNSAVEAVVDRVGTEEHSLAGRAKDLGSAAVFVSLVLVLVVWVLIGLDNFGLLPGRG